MRLVLLGPPGAGKGTLAALLKKSLGILHISTGDMLRDEIKHNTPVGHEAKKLIDNGNLVSDELITTLIKARLKELPSNNYMLDGYPRTLVQAEQLDEYLNDIHKPLDCAVYMEASLKKIIFRLSGRMVCRNCGMLYHRSTRPPLKTGVCNKCSGELYQREDDNEETIKTRMHIYQESTKPIVQYYESKGKLIRIDGDAESEDLEAQLLKKFNESKASNQPKDSR